MNTSVLKNKKILITGSRGFIGSHLVERLSSSQAKVFGISQSYEDKKTLKANILHFDTINEIIKKKKIDICIHLAGESLVEKGQSNPFETFKVNIQGTLNILESSRINKLEKVIVASTTHVYGKNKLPYYEGYPPKPSRPYETSKTCVDLIAQSYADTFNLPVLIPRFVNIFGPGDLNFNRLIPRIMKAIYKDKKLQMWGGEIRRDYLYVDDAVSAYLHLAAMDNSYLEKNRIFNFGSGSIVTVKEIIDKILQNTSEEIVLEKVKEERVSEIKSQYVSFKKAKRILSWEPAFTFEEGLKKTMLWYKKYFK
jgi:CDP-glucose 4,6-dehydratase